jgi:hypothetical protein
MIVVPLLLSAAFAAATPSVAVVDFSTPRAPELVSALSRMPQLKGRVQDPAETRAIVDDAEGLGVSCTIDDVPCLRKLLVLLKADELVVIEQGRTRVEVLWLTDAGPRRGVAPAQGSAVARAKAAWVKASRALPGPGVPAGEGGENGDDGDDDDDDGPAPRLPRPPRPPLDRELPPPPSTPALERAPNDPLHPGFIVGAVGIGVTALAGASALIVSDILARQLDAAANGGEPLPESYYALETAFLGLAVAAVVGVVVAGGGFVAAATAGE